jgi:hypothetical protein
VVEVRCRRAGRQQRDRTGEGDWGFAAAAGRRGEHGERQARAGVQASGYANARKYWAAGIAHGVLGHQVHAPAERRVQ